MSNFAIILLESSVALLLFYLVYFLWLRKETFFQANRVYLILSALIALAIPWLNFTYQPASVNVLVLRNVLDAISITATGYEQTLLQKIASWQWLLIIYLLGVGFSLLLFLYKVGQIVILGSKIQKTDSSSFVKNVQFVDADIIPFSFLNKIYVNPKNYSNIQLNKIVAHEQVHVNQLHTFDCLFYELLIVLFWFHPIVYRYRTSAKEIHEYLADNGAIKSGVSAQAYKELLFEQATGLSTLKLANSFNYSLIKRRLIMLTKMKSKKVVLMRMMYFLPIFTGLILAFACTESDEVSTVNKKSEQLITNKLDSDIQDSEVFDIVEDMPEYPGGTKQLRVFVSNNVKYPTEAKEAGLQARVFIQFIVDETGKVVNVKNVATRVETADGNVGVLDSDDNAAIYGLLEQEAIRVISCSPLWKPGMNGGNPVKVSFTIPINFSLN